ncbi:MAG: hypothetical protein M3247_03045 [Thermoproteota archaeon]|nr:hypothetical protein [Thermoproteota archaeon]
MASQASQEAKDNMVFDSQTKTFSQTSKYYGALYSDYFKSAQEQHDYLDRAEKADEYSRQSIIATALLTASVVILGELTRKSERRKENRSDPFFAFRSSSDLI